MSSAIKRLFIANRGEIARRIALTARRLHIETVVVSDRETLPAFLAGVVTRFVRVEEESPSLYLNAKKMIEIAKAAQCDAVHPGFGFLSENAEFAQLCLDAGLIWVGPRPTSIAAMASKAAARDYAAKAGVPCVEGLQGLDLSQDEAGAIKRLTEFAQKTGFPLLIKAAFGGGGKGMRLVHQVSELKDNALRAFSEAKSSFGSGSLVVERYVAAPRHVEVQILADKSGHVYAIGDRDCSLQRRHQKIIEEAPAPDLTSATREAMHEAAVRLAAAVGYDSAGTVEFLVDAHAKPNSPQDVQTYYFLEMNTRLQVEHPVTEEVYGLDLVEWQLRVAVGQTLPAEFKQIVPRGHSIEVRLYAENVSDGFFPAPGPVHGFCPALGPGVRWELGIDTVDEVSSQFDPMVAKLVVTGANRGVALDRMADTLQQTFFATKHSNRDLLIWLVGRSAFRDGPVTTHFIQDHLHEFLEHLQVDRATFEPQALKLLEQLENGRLGLAAPEARGTLHGTRSTTAQAFQRQGQPKPTESMGQNAQTANPSSSLGLVSLETLVASPKHPLDQSRLGRGTLTSTDGKAEGFWYASRRLSGLREFWVSLAGRHFSLVRSRAALSAGRAGEAAAGIDVVAPVPGKIVQIKVAPGALVEIGQAVVVLESMKMEFEVKAARKGILGAVLVQVGQQVAAGEMLATWSLEKRGSGYS